MHRRDFPSRRTRFNVPWCSPPVIGRKDKERLNGDGVKLYARGATSLTIHEQLMRIIFAAMAVAFCLTTAMAVTTVVAYTG
jgi:hypothetical protein